MRSEGLEYGEYLYVQRETREGGRGGERGGCRRGLRTGVSSTGSLILFTNRFEERRRPGMCDREQETGSFMERQEPRASAPHQIQGFSVLDRNDREGMGGREGEGGGPPLMQRGVGGGGG